MKQTSKLDGFFKLTEKKTTVRRELVAGLITFMTMAYVFVTQPGAIVGFGAAEVIDANGVVITSQSIVILTALISGIITLFMGLYANMPFALSTAMGMNFILGGSLQAGYITFAQMMAITLISGIIFLVMSVLGMREVVVRAIPKNLKVSITVVVGFFITYLGLSNSGIGDFSAGLALGDLTQPSVLLALIGIFLTAALMVFKVKGAILFGIIITTIIGIPMGVTMLPAQLFAAPDFSAVGGLLFQLDFKTIWTPEFLILIFIAFCSDFFSTLGTVLAVGNKANMMDEDGNFPNIQKPFIVDSVGTVVGSVAGCTTITTYVESTSGVEAGGRTGLTAVTSGILFLLVILFAPLCTVIPSAATAPALLFVGFSMFQCVKDIDFSDFSEAFAPFFMIVIGIFSANIGTGIAAGLLAHVILKVCTGKFKEVSIGLYLLSIPLVLYFLA